VKEIENRLLGRIFQTQAVRGCGDCPFQNTDAELCNIADHHIAVWDVEHEKCPPSDCPLLGGGMLVYLREVP
jgi:hypothetical protein